MNTALSALLVDRYELTMVDAALLSGTANRRCVFEVFTRKLPDDRKYGVVAGTGRLLEALQEFQFSSEEIEWLQKQHFLRPQTLEWLREYRFRGDVFGHREGEVFFAQTPVLRVEASFAEAVLLETLILSVLNHDSAIATAASRMVQATQGKPLAEMGSRRTHEQAAVAAARAAYIAGFTATSNLRAGMLYGIPTMGTAAHAFTLLHPSESEAFRAQIAALTSDTTLLVDTYNIEQGVRNAVEIAGPSLQAVRIDSGDLPVLVRQVRDQLDALGAKNTGITVTNDLDEYTLAALASSPVNSFGVGTSVATGSGHPTMGFVYKLTSRENEAGEWESVAKTSQGKESIGGRKYVYRGFNAEGKAVSEHVFVEEKRDSLRGFAYGGETGEAVSGLECAASEAVHAEEHGTDGSASEVGGAQSGQRALHGSALQECDAQNRQMRENYAAPHRCSAEPDFQAALATAITDHMLNHFEKITALLMSEGQALNSPNSTQALHSARARLRASLEKLPLKAHSLQRGEPALRTHIHS